MDDLIAFLLARLDNEAELARATMSRANPREGVWTFADMQIRDDAGHLVVRHTWPNEGEHIAHNDPARTLRDIDARRKTLARCQEEMLSGIPRLTHFAKMTVWEMAQRWSDHKEFSEDWRP